MKLRKLFILLICVCVSAALLGGCDKTQPEDGTAPPTGANINTPSPTATDNFPDNTDDNADGTNTPIDAAQLYADMSLSGTVAEFTSDGCTVIPIITEQAGDGSVASQAVPGTEDKGKNVMVTYNDDCVFQIAVINVEAGSAVLSDAAKEDIKKQTTLMLYGDYQDTYHLNVSKVVIQRLEGASQ